jgi:hypothetical protein
MNILFVILIIFLLLFAVSFIVLKYYYVGEREKDKQNILFDASPIIKGVWSKTYCGYVNSTPQDSDNGPLWRRAGVGNCNDNRQDWWLGNNIIESIVNYCDYTNDPSYAYLFIPNIDPDGVLIRQAVMHRNGAWNDDCLWLGLSMMRLYEYGETFGQKGGAPKRYPYALQYASLIFNSISYSPCTLIMPDKTQKTFWTTWWQYDANDPLGMNTYRNGVTNSLYLVLAMKLYKQSLLVSDPESYFMKKSETYWNIAQHLVSFIKLLITPSTGLLNDGIGRSHITTPNTPQTYFIKSGQYYNYNQGVMLKGFSLVAMEYYDRDQIDEYDDTLSIVYRLMKIMTLTPEENIETYKPSTCNLDMAMKIKCGSGSTDQKTCLTNTNCCFKGRRSNDIEPFCYSPGPERVNNLLVEVNGVNILTELPGVDPGGSEPAFKGIFVRHLSYAMDIIHQLPAGKEHKWVKLLQRAKQFLIQNAEWVTKTPPTSDGLYAYWWQLRPDQINTYRASDPVFGFTTASTFSVVDLINSANKQNRMK